MIQVQPLDDGLGVGEMDNFLFLEGEVCFCEILGIVVYFKAHRFINVYKGGQCSEYY